MLTCFPGNAKSAKIVRKRKRVSDDWERERHTQQVQDNKCKYLAIAVQTKVISPDTLSTAASGDAEPVQGEKWMMVIALS